MSLFKNPQLVYETLPFKSSLFWLGHSGFQWVIWEPARFKFHFGGTFKYTSWSSHVAANFTAALLEFNMTRMWSALPKVPMSLWTSHCCCSFRILHDWSVEVYFLECLCCNTVNITAALFEFHMTGMLKCPSFYAHVATNITLLQHCLRCTWQECWSVLPWMSILPQT